VTGRYNVSGQYASSQNFKASKLPDPTEFVMVKINSNYGNPDYTCLYRVRVHGEAAESLYSP
jgi:Sad1 / UNC-like C-terminal